MLTEIFSLTLHCCDIAHYSTLIRISASKAVAAMRYTIEEIRQMPEGQTFDCKSIHIEPKALANTIVAMANADGGMVAVGISDKTRRIEGVDQDKAHLNEILRTPFDFCVPTISVTTEFMPCQDDDGNENHILIIHVPASPRLHANQADEVF